MKNLIILLMTIGNISIAKGAECEYFAKPTNFIKKKATCWYDNSSEVVSVFISPVGYRSDGEAFGSDFDGMTYSSEVPKSNLSISNKYSFASNYSYASINAFRVQDELITRYIPDPHRDSGFRAQMYSDCGSTIFDEAYFVSNMNFFKCSQNQFNGETSCASKYIYNNKAWLEISIVRVCK